MVSTDIFRLHATHICSSSLSWQAAVTGNAKTFSNVWLKTLYKHLGR